MHMFTLENVTVAVTSPSLISSKTVEVYSSSTTTKSKKEKIASANHTVAV